MCPDWELHWQPFGPQVQIQPKKMLPTFVKFVLVLVQMVTFENTCIFFKDFIYLFLERGREREREEEKHQCVVASCAHPTGDLAHNPGMCPDWESNLRPFGSQSGAQSTEPHQPGQQIIF